MLEEKVKVELSMSVVRELDDYNENHCFSANSSFNGIIRRILLDNETMRTKLAKKKK
jgi:hypothetical protein